MPRILALDYGERRLGFSLSDPSGTIAMPHSVAEVHSENHAIQTVSRVCNETGAERLVIGLPVNMDGTKGSAAEKVQAFASKIAAQTKVPVATWDERLTTSQAERVLLQADLPRTRRKKVRDKIAAQMILQGYLDSISTDNPQT